jgi:hypothetical protein
VQFVEKTACSNGEISPNLAALNGTTIFTKNCRILHLSCTRDLLSIRKKLQGTGQRRNVVTILIHHQIKLSTRRFDYPSLLFHFYKKLVKLLAATRIVIINFALVCMCLVQLLVTSVLVRTHCTRALVINTLPCHRQGCQIFLWYNIPKRGKYTK